MQSTESFCCPVLTVREASSPWHLRVRRDERSAQLVDTQLVDCAGGIYGNCLIVFLVVRRFARCGASAVTFSIQKGNVSDDQKASQERNVDVSVAGGICSH